MRPSLSGQHQRATATLALTLSLTGLTAVSVPASASAAPCSAVEFVYARGTLEPGTLGLFTGQAVYGAIQKKLTDRTTSNYPVNYPASLDVFSSPNSAEQGNTDLVVHVTAQAAACPAQRFVLAGYSQGANVVDNSLGISSDGSLVGGKIVATIPASIAPKVAAVLLFGNPIRAIGKSVTGLYAARAKDYCAVGDPVCQAGGTDVTAHLTYGSADAADAAAFVASRV